MSILGTTFIMISQSCTSFNEYLILLVYVVHTKCTFHLLNYFFFILTDETHT